MNQRVPRRAVLALGAVGTLWIMAGGVLGRARAPKKPHPTPTPRPTPTATPTVTPVPTMSVTPTPNPTPSDTIGPRPEPASLSAYKYSTSIGTFAEWQPNLSAGTVYTPGAGLDQTAQDTFLASVPAGTVTAPSIIDLRGVAWVRNASIKITSDHNYTVIYGYGGSLEITLVTDPGGNENNTAAIWIDGALVSTVHHFKILGLEVKGRHTAAGTHAAYGWDHGRGITLASAVQDIEIADCHVHNVFSDSISVYGGNVNQQLQRFNLHHNLLELDGRQAITLGQGRQVYIERNIVRNGGSFVDAEDARTTSEHLENIYIRNNLVDGWGWHYFCFYDATTLAAASSAGATNIKVVSVTGQVVGDAIQVGTPGTGEATVEACIVTAIGTAGAGGTGIDVTPALAYAHSNGEPAVRGQYWNQYCISFQNDSTQISQPMSEIYIERNTFQRGSMGWGDLDAHLWGATGETGNYTTSHANLIGIGWPQYGTSTKTGIYVQSNDMTGIPSRKRVGRLIDFRNVTTGAFTSNNAPGYTSSGVVQDNSTGITVSGNTL